jgi:hypothetical protein
MEATLFIRGVGRPKKCLKTERVIVKPYVRPFSEVEISENSENS